MAQRHGTQQDLSRKLNTLESAITNAEDSAEDARWQQASIVVQMRDDGMKPGNIAADWHNGRTGKPYARQHVIYCERAWRRWGVSELTDRPDWTTAYYTVQQGADEVIEPEQRRQEWSDAHEARAPKTEQTAAKLVDNLLKGPSDVVDTVYRGLAEGRTGIRSGARTGQDPYVDPTTVERRRKEAEAWVKGVGEPMLNSMGKLAAVLSLENALEELQEVTSIDGAAHDQIIRLIDEIRTEAQVKHAMEGVR